MKSCTSLARLLRHDANGVIHGRGEENDQLWIDAQIARYAGLI
jgi:hypothetical protein